MEADTCPKGANAFGKLLGGDMPNTPGIPIAISSTIARHRAHLLASNIAATATALNAIRRNESQSSEDRQRDTGLVCKECEKMLRRFHETIYKLESKKGEKEAFLVIETGARETFRRLANLCRLGKLNGENLFEEGVALTKIAMLCNALRTESLAALAKRIGFSEMCEASACGLWLHSISTCIEAARERIKGLEIADKEMKRAQDVHAFVSAIARIIETLVLDLRGMADLVKGIGEGITPPQPVALEDVILFAERILATVGFLNREWRGLAPCQLDQTAPLRKLVEDTCDNLILISPHPVPVPCFGCWYEYYE